MNQPYEIPNHAPSKPWNLRDVLEKCADGTVRCVPPGFQYSKSTNKEQETK